jgi:hypothetical protein
MAISREEFEQNTPKDTYENIYTKWLFVKDIVSNKAPM